MTRYADYFDSWGRLVVEPHEWRVLRLTPSGAWISRPNRHCKWMKWPADVPFAHPSSGAAYESWKHRKYAQLNHATRRVEIARRIVNSFDPDHVQTHYPVIYTQTDK